MLEAQRTDGGSTEVCVIPENRQCGEVADIRRAEFAPGGSLLGCLRVSGRLVLWDPADRDAPPAAVDGCYTDFSWEEAAGPGPGGSFRLLAAGAPCELKLLEVEASTSASTCLRRVRECPSDQLLEAVRERDSSVSELQSVRVLSFAAGLCCVLLDCDWLLQLRWQRAEEEPQTLSCCRIQLTDSGRHDAVHHSVCRETLFVLSSSGLISVFSISDGSLLASVDLPAYLSSGPADDDLVSSPPSFSSFCLLQDVSGPSAVCRSPLSTSSPAPTTKRPGQPVELQLQPARPRFDLQY
ncbi:Spatacsin [Larimichthys crocea]|uniref:Uncharacterized protein n=1 Tax=Larimichthys crocea TaxID=215358 RepID=A0ACD3QGF7_LARCR|nr:Spatacsin [Larimichthys crocea]